MYPEWCCNAVEGYLEWLERSFYSTALLESISIVNMSFVNIC